MRKRLNYSSFERIHKVIFSEIKLASAAPDHVTNLSVLIYIVITTTSERISDV